MKMTQKWFRPFKRFVFFIGFLLVFVSVAQMIIVFSHPYSREIVSSVVTRNIHSVNLVNTAWKPTTSQLAKLLKDNTVTPSEARALFRTERYYRKIDQIIKDASTHEVAPHKVNSSRLRPDKQQLLLIKQELAGGNDLGSFSEGWEDLSQNNNNDVFQNNNHADLLIRDSVPSFSSNINNTIGTDIRRLSELSRLLDILKKRTSRSDSLHRFKEFNTSDELELKSLLGVDAPSVEDFYKEERRLLEDRKRAQNDGRGQVMDSSSQGTLNVCPRVPNTLVGNFSSLVNLSKNVKIIEILENNRDMQEGGEWKPPHCVARHRVAIIVPFRDRWSHLKVLLYHLIPMLKRQQIHFSIFVVEQYGNGIFNKGIVMNSAFREAIKLFDFQCVIFHDVDLVPEDDRNMYTCTEHPKHMSIAIDKFEYFLPYESLVGGVLSFQTSHFQLVNGYSNMYWGWGAEDDDIAERIWQRGLRIYRPPAYIARYKMAKHGKRKSTERSYTLTMLQSAAHRSKLEGLNNVKYKLLFTHTERLFTHFMVDVGYQ